MKNYIIICPKCKSTFDCTPEIVKWKLVLEECSKVLDQIKQLNNTGGKNGNTKRTQ